MEVYQQLPLPGGGLPVDVLHGVLPAVGPEAGELQGVVVHPLFADDAAHELGEGDGDALGVHRAGQHVEGGVLGEGGEELLGHGQVPGQEARLVDAVIAPPAADEVQAAGDALPGPQGEDVPAVGGVAHRGVVPLGELQALVHVEADLHRGQGQELVVFHHLPQGGLLALYPVLLGEGELGAEALVPKSPVEKAQQQVEPRRQQENPQDGHLSGPNLPWGLPPAGAGPRRPGAGRRRSPPSR